jgi:hypothetical protein
MIKRSYSYYNLASLALSFFPIIFLSAYALARIGFDNDFLLYGKVIGFSLLLLNCDWLVTGTWGPVSRSNFYVLILLFLVGVFFFFDAPEFLSIGFSFLGYVVFTLNLFHCASFFKVKKNWPHIVVTGILLIPFTLYIFAAVYTNFLNPFYTELTSLGVHTDILYHGSIAQMLKTYQIPSTGVDGLNPIHYHFGSHIMVASLSKILDINVLLFYQLAYPCIVTPLFLKAFLYFVFDLFSVEEKKEKNSYLIFLLLFLAGFLGFLNYDGDSKISMKALIGWQFIYVHESYTTSLFFLFVLLSTFIRHRRTTEEKFDWNQIGFILLSLLLFIAACFSKISTGFLLFCLAEFFFIRLAAFRKVYWVIGNLVFIGVAVWIYTIVDDPRDGEGNWYFFQLFREVNKAPIVWFILLHFFWTFVVILYHLIYLRIRSFKDLLDAFKEKKLLLVELVVVLSLGGLIPGNVMFLWTRDGVYFSEPQNWVAFGIVLYMAVCHPVDSERVRAFTLRFILPIMVILSVPFYDHNFEEWFDTSILFSFVPVMAAFFMPSLMRINPLMLRRFLLLIIFWPFIVEVAHNTETLVERVRNNTNLIRLALLPSKEVTLEYRHFPALELIKEKSEALKKDSIHQFYQKLFSLDKWSIKEKRTSIIYVTSRSAYKKIYPCVALPFIMPAITGIVQYRGLVPYDLCDNFGFSLETFKWYHSSEMANVNTDYVKRDVRQKGYKKLILINVDQKTVDIVSIN